MCNDFLHYTLQLSFNKYVICFTAFLFFLCHFARKYYNKAWKFWNIHLACVICNSETFIFIFLLSCQNVCILKNISYPIFLVKCIFLLIYFYIILLSFIVVFMTLLISVFILRMFIQFIFHGLKRLLFLYKHYKIHSIL